MFHLQKIGSMDFLELNSKLLTFFTESTNLMLTNWLNFVVTLPESRPHHWKFKTHTFMKYDIAKILIILVQLVTLL